MYAIRSYYDYLNQGQSQKAIELLLRQVEYFKKRNENYLTIIYSFLGDAYLMESELDLSVKYYKWALSISEANNSHGNYRPTLYKKLSKVYVQKRDYKNAYEALEKAKELDELLYDSRSFNNKPLLEISDEFRKEKEVQKKLIQEQRIAQLEYEDSVGSLQLIIMLVVFIALVILAYLYIRFVKSKHKSEQALITKSIDLENQKQRELLELKNKELASSALRLIEKDEVIRRLKTAIVDKKESLSDAAIKRLFKSISGSSVQNWEEFEARFMAVNESFYERLNKQFPNLTQGDRKLCALIKLEFNSKEIAQLMGVSIESVHTIRYRLRRKLGLDRSDNLSEFINDLV